MRKIKNLRWKETNRKGEIVDASMTGWIRLLMNQVPQEKLGKGWEEMNKIHVLYEALRDDDVEELYFDDSSYNLLLKFMNFMPAGWGSVPDFYLAAEEIKNHAVKVQKGTKIIKEPKAEPEPELVLEQIK